MANADKETKQLQAELKVKHMAQAAELHTTSIARGKRGRRETPAKRPRQLHFESVPPDMDEAVVPDLAPGSPKDPLRIDYSDSDDELEAEQETAPPTLCPRLCPPTVTMSAPTSVAIPTTVAAPVTETAAAPATATTTSANPLAAFTW